MQKHYSIAFVGAGNLAWHLGPALENLGHRVSHVYSRSDKNARELIERLYSANHINTLDFTGTSVEMVFITVSDQAIPAIVNEIILPDNCHLIHTSGCQPLSALAHAAAAHTGIIYPLQTFTKNAKVDFRSIPVFLESDSGEGIKQLYSLTRGLSNDIHELDGYRRSVIHLAAVISTNFSNHLFTVAKRILDKHGIDYQFLQPVAQTMIDKVFSTGPEGSQTGPARRKDFDTMDRHLKLLEDERELSELYSMLSRHIGSSY